MKKSYGKAGQGARKMAFDRELKVAGIAGVMLLLIWIWSKNMASIASLGLPAVIVLVIGFKLIVTALEKKGKHLKKRAKDANKGALAEEKVEAKLAALPEGYVNFNDLVFPGFNIDHVAVGPGGVFVIETKSHGGKVTNNGNQLLLNGTAPEKDFINQTWSQTYHIKNLLKERLGKDIPVHPLLCFTNAFVQVRGTVKGVSVVNGGYLNTHIVKQKPFLDKTMIEQVTAILKIVTNAAEPENQVAQQRSNAGHEFWEGPSYPAHKGVLSITPDVVETKAQILESLSVKPDNNDVKNCPQCGDGLVIREYKSGLSSGEQFLGCRSCRKAYPLDLRIKVDHII